MYMFMILSPNTVQAHEASMMAISCVVEEVKLGRAQLDCQIFTDKVLLPDLTTPNGTIVSFPGMELNTAFVLQLPHC